MTCAISKPQFILLFIYVIFIAHTLAEPSEEVKNEIMAWRKRSHEARLSTRTNRSLQSLNVTGFHSNVTGFQKPQDSSNDEEASPIWAGALQSSPPSGTYRTVSAVWYVPDITFPPGASEAGQWGAAVWVGIDGWATSSCPNALVQAGTYTYLEIDPEGRMYKGAVAWYEWFPASMVFLPQTAYPVNIGDPISVEVEASSPSQAIVVFINTDTNEHATRSFSAPNSPGDNICGDTAEWILERISISQLADFGLMHIESCQATTTTGDSVSLDGATLVFMQEDDDTVLASPSFVSTYELAIEFGDSD